MKSSTSRWNLVVLILLFALVIVAARPAPSEAQSERPWRVVIKPLVPFVFQEGDAYKGFSIDLWEEIAARVQHDYTYEWVETASDQLAAVKFGRGDVSIMGMSITKQREEMVDFSLSYFQAGLRIMTDGGGSSGWVTPLELLRQVFASGVFHRTLLGIGVLVLVAAHIFWLLERHRNPDFPKTYLKGIWQGIWYSVVTLVTVGYGDRTARSVLGRLFAMVWMFLSLLLVAGFTANITSQLTLNRFQGLIQGESDLPGKRIATVNGSTAARYLEGRGLPYSGVENIEDAYSLLDGGLVDAIVYDSPVLQYYALNQGQGTVQLVGDLFEPQDYGIAFPTGSPDRETINQMLLDIKEDGTYDRIYQKWFGGQ